MEPTGDRFNQQENADTSRGDKGSEGSNRILRILKFWISNVIEAVGTGQPLCRIDTELVFEERQVNLGQVE